MWKKASVAYLKLLSRRVRPGLSKTKNLPGSSISGPAFTSGPPVYEAEAFYAPKLVCWFENSWNFTTVVKYFSIRNYFCQQQTYMLIYFTNSFRSFLPEVSVQVKGETKYQDHTGMQGTHLKNVCIGQE